MSIQYGDDNIKEVFLKTTVPQLLHWLPMTSSHRYFLVGRFYRERSKFAFEGLHAC